MHWLRSHAGSPALVQCLRSRVGEPGNEASADMYKIPLGCILVCSLENNKIIIEL